MGNPNETVDHHKTYSVDFLQAIIKEEEGYFM